MASNKSMSSHNSSHLSLCVLLRGSFRKVLFCTNNEIFVNLSVVVSVDLVVVPRVSFAVCSLTVFFFLSVSVCPAFWLFGCILFFVFGFFANQARGANVTWVGSISGYWENPNNWDTNTVPQPNDDVNLVKAVTVYLQTNSIELNKLTIVNNAILDASIFDISTKTLVLSAGTIKGTGKLTTTSSFLWM